ncbi:MAG TPA: hypothetical protein VFV27_04285 [Nevskiaceae bacterium]|nr:hypothetical protein [Nevskiaceae bacterium]
MRDDFEASFQEQLQAIEAETLDGPVDLERLPAALSERSLPAPYCFAYPAPVQGADDPASILREQVWEPESRQRAAALMVRYSQPGALREQMLGGADDATLAACARILAVLVCAEESAINVFEHECGRLQREQVQANERALREIETEERVHNWLIQQARAHLPAPEDLDAIRRRTRRLFMRVASRDIAEHFARLTGLDSGVCISLSALLGSAKVRRLSGFAELLTHIRHDEATHVRKSREHAVGLGFDATRFHECYDLTRTGMVEMLRPISSSFETLEVDPERLFKRLLRFQDKRSVSSAEVVD